MQTVPTRCKVRTQREPVKRDEGANRRLGVRTRYAAGNDYVSITVLGDMSGLSVELLETNSIAREIDAHRPASHEATAIAFPLRRSKLRCPVFPERYELILPSIPQFQPQATEDDPRIK